MANKITRLWIGGTNVWMDGTKEEVIKRLTNRFKVYETRPTKKQAGKVAQPTKAKPEPQAVS